MTREQWLLDAVAQMKNWVENAAEGQEFEEPLVSVGFPKGGRGGKGGTRVGECSDKTVSGDKERAHIFIIPTLPDKVEILHILLHEMIHASVGTACGHRKEFRKVAVELGLKPPMTATTPSEPLKLVLEGLAEELGEYPHPGLKPTKRGLKGSRLIKVECFSCGCIIRMTNKWIHDVGTPTCGCGTKMEVAQ